MATYTKLPLSGSTNGKQIKVVQTATAGDTIHTAVAGTSSWDEIWLWAVNTHTSAILLTIEWGEETAPDGNIQVNIPPQQGLILVAPGLLLQNELVVKAFAGTANKIIITGFVNRITP